MDRYPDLSGQLVTLDSLRVSIRGTITAVVRFEQEDVIGTVEQFEVDPMGTYRGFELYGIESSPTGAEMYAAKAPVLFRSRLRDHDDDRTTIEHLIGLQEGVHLQVATLAARREPHHT